MAEEKKSGFSYVSEEKQKKRAGKLLAVEVILLMFASIAIIFFLNYLNIINLNFIPKEIPFLGIINSGKIIIVSDNPSYKVKIKDQGMIKKVLADWGVFSNPLESSILGSSNGVIINKVEIHLTDKQQKNFVHVKDDDKYASTGVQFAQKKVIIMIYLGKEILEGQDRNDISRGSALMSSSFRALYHLRFPPQAPSLSFDKRDEEFGKEMQKIYQLKGKEPILLIEKL